MKLSQVCTVSSSKRIYASEYKESGIPFYRGLEISEMSQGNYEFERIYISEERYFELSQKYYMPKENDILITAVGTIGNMYVVGKDDKFYFKDGNLLMLSNFSKDVNPYFVYLYLQSNSVQQFIKNSANNSIQKALTIDMLRNLDIELPDKPDQDRVCKIIKSIDDLMKNNRRKIRLLTNKMQAIYSFYFQAFVGKDKPIYSKELNMNIPANYEVVKIEDLLLFEKGFEPTSKAYIDNPKSKDGLMKFYRVGDMDDTGSTYIKKEIAQNTCIENDVMVAFDASIGRISFGLNGAYSSGMQKVWFKNRKIKNGMAYLIMSDDRIQQTLLNGSKSNSIIKHASSLKKYLFVAYNEADYLYVDSIIEPFFDEAVQLKKINSCLEDIKHDIFLAFLNKMF